MRLVAVKVADSNNRYLSLNHRDPHSTFRGDY
jgi:hypothetical protein